MPSPKLDPLVLSGAEREPLEALVRKRTASQSLAQRARIAQRYRKHRHQELLRFLKLIDTAFHIRARTGDHGAMALGLEVAFTDDHVFFPAGHLSRTGATFDGTLAAAAIRDADPAAAPPEIRAVSGEVLFISATQRADLERFCRAHQIPARKRPDIWGDLLEPFLGTQPRLQHLPRGLGSPRPC